MKRINIFETLILLTVSICPVHAQINLTSGSSDRNTFPLATTKTVATLCHDPEDAEVVGKSCELLAADIEAVTGQKPDITTRLPRRADNMILAGTIGNNRWIDLLIEKGRIDVSPIRNGWEQYAVALIENPFPGIEKALVIAGCDRRGTAYGIFSISELIGVSPWYWWADVPIPRKSTISLSVNDFCSETPSVKYRGIFINDEDWGLLPWASKVFEPETGSIGPKTYAKVCELLLRLKANYLCPAMHRRSIAFNQIPENKVVADSYGIVMGSVHCEPLLFNNASEWHRKTMGEWNYETNKETINRVLRERVSNNAPYENVYTLALRGLHDKAMEGDTDMEARKRILSEALNDQRQILTDVLKKPIEEIPQAFTPYKEVLDIYSKGLVLPDEVTIIWPDDNFGYMKRLSNPQEQKRSGRAGVYYHVSYHGKPHDYLWLCTTPPTLMFEELDKAYRTTADRIWLLNVGDIKPGEFAMDMFLRMAYDFDAFSFEKSAVYHAEWLSDIFGREYYEDLLQITDDYYRLAFSSKPEYMGWGHEWNTKLDKREHVTDTDYSFANYNEAETRLADYARLVRDAEAIMDRLDEAYKPAYYQLVYYPVKGSELMNRMLLLAQKNRWYAVQGRAATNILKAEAAACHDSLTVITDQYNSLLDGKWNYMMSMVQGVTANYFKFPKLDSVTLLPKATLGVLAESEDVLKGVHGFHALPCFNKYLPQSYYFDVFNKGILPLEWEASVSDPWIRVSKQRGKTVTEERIMVEIDWAKAPTGDRISGHITVRGAGSEEQIIVSLFNPESPSLEELKGLYVENNGYVSIDAAGFHRKKENDLIKMTPIDNLGFENRCIQIGDPLAPPQDLRDTIPYLEYDFYTFNHGSVDVYTYMLPTFPLYPNQEFGGDFAGNDPSNSEAKYGVCIDDVVRMAPTISSFEYSQSWTENVLKNCSIKKTTLNIDRPGRHTIKILCGTPGVVLQKIVIDLGGMKRSYLGPRPTKVNE